MIEGGKGGGSTTKGAVFEKKVDLVKTFQNIDGYTVIEKKGKNLHKIYDVFFKGEIVAEVFKEHALYRYLEYKGVQDSKNILSKKLLPDGVLVVVIRKTLFIIEVKWQQSTGSVDEKLQTCDFKRKQYKKLVKSLDLKVEFVYILNDWFKKPEYQDTLDYIDSVNCHYKFNKISLVWFGLPES